jgi:hypothetical protein
MANPLSPPEAHASDVDQGASRWSDGPKWYTIAEAAALCHRAPGTVRNLLSAHQAHTRSGWLVHRRRRRKVILLKPAIVNWLVAVTLLNDAAARAAGPPR